MNSDEMIFYFNKVSDVEQVKAFCQANNINFATKSELLNCLYKPKEAEQ